MPVEAGRTWQVLQVLKAHVLDESPLHGLGKQATYKRSLRHRPKEEQGEHRDQRTRSRAAQYNDNREVDAHNVVEHRMGNKQPIWPHIARPLTCQPGKRATPPRRGTRTRDVVVLVNPRV